MSKIFIFLMLLSQGITLFSIEIEQPKHDILIYKNNEYNIGKGLMKDYFNKYPEKCISIFQFSMTLPSSSGYVAVFEIIKNELWVVDIKIYGTEYTNGKYIPKNISIIDECLDGNDRMKLDWYSGVIIIPQGRRVEEINIGYEYGR